MSITTSFVEQQLHFDAALVLASKDATYSSGTMQLVRCWLRLGLQLFKMLVTALAPASQDAGYGSGSS